MAKYLLLASFLGAGFLSVALAQAPTPAAGTWVDRSGLRGTINLELAERSATSLAFVEGTIEIYLYLNRPDLVRTVPFRVEDITLP